MRVIVVMPVNRQCMGGVTAEKGAVLRAFGHRAGRSVATDVTVETHHGVGGRHNDMQIMRNEQHAAVEPIAYFANQFIESDFTGEIHTLNRFVQNHQIGFADQRPGQQRPLKLAAGQTMNRCGLEIGDADLLQDGVDLMLGMRSGKPHQTPDGHGQCGIDLYPLRHIAHPQRGASLDPTLVRLNDSHQGLGGGALAASVGPNQGHDLAAPNRQINLPHQPPAATPHADSFGADENGVRITRRHVVRTPAHTPFPAPVSTVFRNDACYTITNPSMIPQNPPMQRSYLLILSTLMLACPSGGLAADPQVVVTIKPLHSLVSGVMGPSADPYLMIQGGASPHAYKLKPSDARALSTAEAVFWIGPDLETFLSHSVANLAPKAESLAMMDAPGMLTLETRSAGDWHGSVTRADGANDHDHGDHHDPHVWLDPVNAQAMVDAVVAALSRIAPEQAATYRSNGATLKRRLDALLQRAAAQVEPVRQRPFVVFHDAFQYLEHRLDLTGAGALTVNPALGTGARRVAEIRDLIRARGAACLFSEPQFEPGLIETIAEGTDVRTAVLDPVGADLDSGPDQYFELLQSNVDVLVQCLGAVAQ